jgi:hypothetical protein
VKERNEDQFSWTLLFVVTGTSFLVFSGLAKLLDALPSHVSLFLKISIAAAILALVSFIKDFIAATKNES